MGNKWHERTGQGETNEWYTPSWIFDALDLKFDLDPCQPSGGISWIPVDQYYTPESNGLISPWSGCVWLNPPYGREVGKWLNRLYLHGNGIALVAARTGTRWFHEYVPKSDGVFFFQGRIRFVDGLQRTSVGGPGFDSMLIAFGSECQEALRTIKRPGWFMNILHEKIESSTEIQLTWKMAKPEVKDSIRKAFRSLLDSLPPDQFHAKRYYLQTSLVTVGKKQVKQPVLRYGNPPHHRGMYAFDFCKLVGYACPSLPSSKVLSPPQAPAKKKRKTVPLG